MNAFRSTMPTRTASTPALLVLAAVFASCNAQPNASEVITGPATDAGPAGPCATLDTCCPTLPAEVVTSCRRLTAQASADECTAELVALSMAGQCGPTPSEAGGSLEASSPDGGHGLDATVGGDAGAATGCILLEACCSSAGLSSAQASTCQSVQGAGQESDCASLFADLAMAGTCTGATYGSGGACPELQQCCGSTSLPTSFGALCASAVSAGVDQGCYELLTTLAPAGYCGGTVPTADGGRPTAGDCATLTMCCGEETFPSNTRPACKQVAAGDEDGNCLSAYEAYVTLGYCD